jgi:hypothetical protein
MHKISEVQQIFLPPLLQGRIKLIRWPTEKTQAAEAHLIEDRVELIDGWCYGAQRPLVQHEATLRQSPHSTARGTQPGQTLLTPHFFPSC